MSWGNGESTLRSSNEKPWLWPAILSTKSQIARELGINASLLGRRNRELKEQGRQAFGGQGKPLDEEMTGLKRKGLNGISASPDR